MVTPIQQSESYHGYDVTISAKSIPIRNDGYYRELVDEVHERGMTILYGLCHQPHFEK
jgi:glycosidase